MNLKLSEVVSQYLDLYNLGKSEYGKAYRVAIRGWRQLNWDITGSIKTVQLSFGADKTVKLPDDFISELDFGVPNGNGGLMSFNKIASFNTDFYLNETQDNISYPPNQRLDVYDTNYIPTAGSLGLGSYNNIGYYQLDTASHCIKLDPSSTASTFILKYLSYTGEDCDDYEINELAQEALLAWIDWQLSKVDKRLGLAEKRDKERHWYAEKANAKLRIKKLTMADLNRSARSSAKMAVKS